MTHLAIWGSILSWFVFLIAYSRFWPTLPMASDMLGIDELVFGTRVFWLGLALVPFTALIADVVYKVIRKNPTEAFITMNDHSCCYCQTKRTSLLSE